MNPRPDGSTPRGGPADDNAEEMLEQAPPGEAVRFAPAGLARHHARPDLARVPLLAVEPLRAAMAWMWGTETGLVRRFAETVRGLVADSPPQCPGGRARGRRPAGQRSPPPGPPTLDA
ncbi:hypothetical protein GCM10010345_00490 [Streptomyces canarius]|uniref:LysR substrate-binding domain-containing protein n=1 Tax=Streptomyces canarius TaxID=285453 RepID=A0ABQ3CC88_9ACTN|nr:hypothetical protein GCM10010345_00490 [Streptomyces canarius]